MNYLPPEHELQERFILTGGPGGQHANRTESGVQLSWDVQASDFLPAAVKQRLLRLAGQRADRHGVLLIEARSHRSQHRNRADARARLAELIEEAWKRPRPRIATRPSRASRLRLRKKQQRRKEIKRGRRPPRLDD